MRSENYVGFRRWKINQILLKPLVPGPSENSKPALIILLPLSTSLPVCLPAEEYELHGRLNEIVLSVSFEKLPALTFRRF